MKSHNADWLAGQAPPRVKYAPRTRANGWEDVADLSASLGVPLDEWQEVALQAAMGERSDGRWAARIVGISTPRQNGKSQLIVARALAGVLLFGEETILVSAHQTDTAREVFHRLLDIIERNPSLARRVDAIMRALNREYIRFRGGATIRIKARSISGSRGFGADCLLLDEAQILGAPAWASILPTMSARANPQAWLLGTPPTPTDDGTVFSKLRQAGLEGKQPAIAWVEWGADPGDDLDDPAIWAKANPAFGTRITAEAIAAERAAMTDEEFARERLGIWDDISLASIIPRPNWEQQADTASIAVDRLALGVEVGPDLAWASVALAGQRADGDWHIELDEDQHTRGRGVEWLIPHLDAIVAANPTIRSIVVDAAGPISALLDQYRPGRWRLRGTRIEVTPVRVPELGAGCSRVLDGIVTGWLWHIGQPQLTAAAMAAGKRALGDTGMWVWSRRAATSDITPIQAATLALIGAQASRPRRPMRAATSTHSGRRREAIVL